MIPINNMLSVLIENTKKIKQSKSTSKVILSCTDFCFELTDIKKKQNVTKT